jgi:hypothetical protein
MPEIQASQELVLTPAQVQTNRWYYEREKLRRFPSFVLLGVNGQVTGADGALDTQYNNTYGIRITLDNYPHALPKVFPKGWSIYPAVPHRYMDGSLCIMRADQWRNISPLRLSSRKRQSGSTSMNCGSGTAIDGLAWGRSTKPCCVLIEFST